jgi:methyltransferase (TIGR00027 family)
MESGKPSRTAYSAALYRAEHQTLDGGSILHDPLAVRLTGRRERESRTALRLFIAMRSRFAEDALAAAVAQGTRQAVILGAGLDTFAYRNPYPQLEVVEVDHPDTQAWKRSRLREAGIAPPPTVTYLPVDFERDTLLVEPGAFVIWLGVVPYLSQAAIDATLAAIPADVVFDYGMPPSSMPDSRRAGLAARAARVAAIGEPWRTYYQPDELAEVLRERGFAVVEDLGPAALARRYLGRDDLPGETPGGHVIHARRV